MILGVLPSPMAKKHLPIYDQPCPTLRMTRLLIQRDKRSLPQLAKDTGLPFYWLRKFRQGNMDAPSINRVCFLYDKLIQTRKC